MCLLGRHIPLYQAVFWHKLPTRDAQVLEFPRTIWCSTMSRSKFTWRDTEPSNTARPHHRPISVQRSRDSLTKSGENLGRRHHLVFLMEPFHWQTTRRMARVHSIRMLNQLLRSHPLIYLISPRCC